MSSEDRDDKLDERILAMVAQSKKKVFQLLVEEGCVRISYAPTDNSLLTDALKEEEEEDIEEETKKVEMKVVKKKEQLEQNEDDDKLAERILAVVAQSKKKVFKVIVEEEYVAISYAPDSLLTDALKEEEDIEEKDENNANHSQEKLCKGFVLIES